MDDLSDIREMYNAGWEIEATRLERHQLEADITRRYLDLYLPPGGKLLEVGFGTGYYTFRLAERGYRITAVDLADEYVRMGKEKAEELGLSDHIEFQIADARNLDGIPLVVDFRNPYTVSWIRVCAYNKVVSPTALGGSRCLDQSRSINPSLRRRRSRKLAGLHDNERHPAPRFTGQRWSWSCRSIRTSRTRSLPRELGSTRER